MAWKKRKIPRPKLEKNCLRGNDANDSKALIGETRSQYKSLAGAILEK
jgi:hypothetical protein